MSNLGVCISRFEARTLAIRLGGLMVENRHWNREARVRIPRARLGGKGGARHGTVRCGAVRCGRLVQGGHSAGAARVRFNFMRPRAAAIGAVMVMVGMLGFSIVSSVVIVEQRVVVELHQYLSHIVAGGVRLDRGARWVSSAGASSTGAGSEMRSSSRPRRERQRAQHCATSKSRSLG